MILKYLNVLLTMVLLTMKDEHSKNGEYLMKGVCTKSIDGIAIKLAGVYFYHGYYVTIY